MECLLFQPHPHKKKIPAECWRAKKIICKRILEKKNFIVNQSVEKKFHDQTKSPTPPPPPPPQKSNGRPLKSLGLQSDPDPAESSLEDPDPQTLENTAGQFSLTFELVKDSTK